MDPCSLGHFSEAPNGADSFFSSSLLSEVRGCSEPPPHGSKPSPKDSSVWEAVGLGPTVGTDTSTFFVLRSPDCKCLDSEATAGVSLRPCTWCSAGVPREGKRPCGGKV